MQPLLLLARFARPALHQISPANLLLTELLLVVDGIGTLTVGLAVGGAGGGVEGHQIRGGDGEQMF